MGISFSTEGDWAKTAKFLRAMMKLDLDKILAGAAKKGVDALSRATPKDTARAALSWDYKIEKSGAGVTISWLNKDIENGFPVAIMLQYGHGTGTGGYVQGRDFINPAMRPIFDEIAETVWKAVTSA